MNAPSLLATALILCAPLAFAESAPNDALRAAIQKSLTYLADGGRDWMEGRNCASCHHAPMTIWSLEHAKQRGFDVDQKTLAEVTAWTLDPKVNLMPKPPAKKAPAVDAKETNAKTKIDADAQAAREAEEAASEEKMPPVLAYYALATQQAALSPVPAEMHAKIVQHLIDKQEADGSWNSWVNHPPMLDCGETSTLYVLLTLMGKDGKAEPTAPDWPTRKARAVAYLAKAKPTDEIQPKLWRLLLRQYLGSSEIATTLGGSKEADISAVMAQQHADGGWGQTPSLPSDAYATGQVLYFLEAADSPISTEARDKAVAFLLKTQKVNGSWEMKSRNRVAPKAGPGAKNLEIIGYAGTAWAAMGLVSAAGDVKSAK